MVNVSVIWKMWWVYFKCNAGLSVSCSQAIELQLASGGGGSGQGQWLVDCMAMDGRTLGRRLRSMV